MGILDDAIREHLDLKRRRGADPTEIERAEQEALGPVRRGPELAAEDLAPEAPALEPEADYPQAESEHWEPFQEDVELHELEGDEELPPYDHARAPDGDPLMEGHPFPPREAEPAPPPPPTDVSPAPEPAPGLAPHPADAPPPPAPPHVDQETEEYELEHEHEPGDDVLETTPEFLQDAPDHDRLWFEQRPPRDFDFDG
jgi:hypothetical protein